MVFQTMHSTLNYTRYPSHIEYSKLHTIHELSILNYAQYNKPHRVFYTTPDTQTTLNYAQCTNHTEYLYYA